MRIIKNISLLFLSTLLYSCSNDGKIKKEIEEMYKHKIVLPIESMAKIDHSEYIMDDVTEQPKAHYKFVLYSDSTECSSCQLRTIYQWNDYYYLEEAGKVNFFIILAPKARQDDGKISPSQIPDIGHILYVDTCNAFLHANPHIPSNPLFHSFLLDENDSVILVGNPVKNKKIEELFFKILEEKQNEK